MWRSRFVLPSLALLLAACDALAIDNCLDGGGVWLEEREQCFCDYEFFRKVDAGESNEQIEFEIEACRMAKTGDDVRLNLERMRTKNSD